MIVASISKLVQSEGEIAENRDGRDCCAQKQTENNFGCKTPRLRPNPEIGSLLILVKLDFANGVSFDNFAGK